MREPVHFRCSIKDPTPDLRAWQRDKLPATSPLRQGVRRRLLLPALDSCDQIPRANLLTVVLGNSGAAIPRRAPEVAFFSGRPFASILEPFCSALSARRHHSMRAYCSRWRDCIDALSTWCGYRSLGSYISFERVPARVCRIADYARNQ
jgi:hypothetical protein